MHMIMRRQKAKSEWEMNRMAFEGKLHGFDLPVARAKKPEPIAKTPEERAFLDQALERAMARKQAERQAKAR